ncbi:MAG: PIN domain-containing protein [Candidatus Margulisbacteria bacterium]|jgi:predicted nucleic acid-binding protein|nr:PIN domain-containing protein [Candidatus Margulisiibacteriota bacterium]
MLLYLDTCCFNRPFDEQVQVKIRLETEAKLYIQQLILEGKYKLAWSYVLDYENNLNPYVERQNRILQWKNIAKKTCNEEESILQEAEKLQKLGLKIVDSLHIACAIYLQCAYIITTDTGMLNKNVSKIAVVNPIDFVRKESAT